MKRAIINREAVLMTVRICCVFLAALLLSACRHQTDRKITSWIPGGGSDERLSITETPEQLPDATAGTVLATPQNYMKQSLMVNGYVGGVELRDLPRDMTALVLMIHDPVNHPAPEPTVAFEPETLELGKRLSPLPGELMSAAEFVDRATINADQCLDHYFKLKSAGSRMRALSNYFSGNEANELASGVDRLADGLQTFAEGYQAIAGIAGESVHDQPLDLEAKPSEPVIPVPPSKFDLQINATAELLEELTEHLIRNRDGLITGHYAVIADTEAANSGFTLLSAGNLYEAAAWRSEGKQDKEVTDLNRSLSLAYVSFGQGMNDLNEGSIALGKASETNVQTLALASAPAAAPAPKLPPMLKCAIVGWNKQVLADAASRLENLRGRAPIQVRGKVFHGNFREEMNQTWIAMETIEVDGLAINLDYDNNWRSARKANDLYRWISATVD